MDIIKIVCTYDVRLLQMRRVAAHAQFDGFGSFSNEIQKVTIEIKILIN